MIDLNSPESVREQLNRGVAGFSCRKDMRAHIIAGMDKRPVRGWIPRLGAVAAVLVVILGIAGWFMNRPVTISELYTLEAGGNGPVKARPVTEHEFVLSVEEDHAILIHRGKLYRMMYQLDGLRAMGDSVGTVTAYSENPYDLRTDRNDYISNAVLKGDTVYAVEGLPVTTALLAEVDGQMALFQRSGEHGYGLNGDSLQDTCGVLGQISSITLENVGTLNGEDAEAVMEILMKKARLENAEALPGEQSLRITLKNGVQLEMSLSGDQLIGCGVWDCTEFLDAFRALVAERAGKQIV